MRKEADSARAEKGALGVGGQGRQGAAGTKCTPRKKFCQGSAQGSAQGVLYEEGGGKRSRTAGGRRREEGGARPRCGSDLKKESRGCSGQDPGEKEQNLDLTKSNLDIDKCILHLILIDTGKKSNM